MMINLSINLNFKNKQIILILFENILIPLQRFEVFFHHIYKGRIVCALKN